MAPPEPIPPSSSDPFSWESLNQWVDDQAPDRERLSQFRILAIRPPGTAQTALRAFGRALNLVLQIGSYGEFLECPWKELVDLYAEQAVRSRLFDLSPEVSVPAEALPYSGEAFETVVRRHNQNPCTAVTVRRRVAVVRTLCPPERPVLVLGDDDFLSVALLEAGYRDVTTLDIDPGLIRRLDLEAKRRGLKLKAQAQDFTAPLSSDLQKPYHLVVFDPMCTVEGVRFFTEAALHFSDRDPGAIFFLHTHLMSLLRPGLSELKGYLDGQGLELNAFYPAFNVYPVAPGARKLLGFLLRVLNVFLRSPALRGDEAVVKWFVSDALVLKHRAVGPARSSAKILPPE